MVERWPEEPRVGGSNPSLTTFHYQRFTRFGGVSLSSRMKCRILPSYIEAMSQTLVRDTEATTTYTVAPLRIQRASILATTLRTNAQAFFSSSKAMRKVTAATSSRSNKYSISGSFNGRTRVFEARYEGSIPSPETTK